MQRLSQACCAAAGLVLVGCGGPAGDKAAAPMAASTAPQAAVPMAPTAAELLGVKPMVAAAPQAPRVPYAFLGKWTAAGRTVVYLQRGDHSVVINAPGPLDEQYAVHSLDERRMVLKYLPLGTLHTIDLDAVPGRGNAPGNTTAHLAPVAPPAAAGDEQQSDN